MAVGTRSGSSFFSIREYRAKRDCVSERCGITVARTRCGFVSLINRGFITKEHSTYTLNSRLHIYSNRKRALTYAMAARAILRTF